MVGYDVVIGFDVEEAPTTVQEQSPDVILIDAMMPKRGEFKGCALLRGKGETRLIPVI